MHETSVSPMDFYILRGRKILGPYAWEEVRDQWKRGELTGEDLTRSAIDHFWTPLARYRAGASMAERVRGWALGAFAEVRGAVERHPWQTGLIWATAGCALVVLSHLPLLIYGPAIVVALWAAVILMVRGSVLAGMVLAIIALLVPALLNMAL